VVTGSKIQNKKIKSKAADKSVRSTLTCLKLVGQVAAKEENRTAAGENRPQANR
jgi:hypothetical protein